MHYHQLELLSCTLKSTVSTIIDNIRNENAVKTNLKSNDMHVLVMINQFTETFVCSARLALPGPEQRSIVSAAGNIRSDQNQSVIIGQLPLPLPEHKTQTEETHQKQLEAKSDQNQSVIIGQLPLHLPEHKIQTERTQQKQLEAKSEISTCQPIIEEPATPETECTQALENDIEDAFYEDTCEIPTIKLNIEEFTLNLQNYMQGNMELQDEMSKALVALTPEAASIPAPKLKNVSRLRTEHCV